MKKIISYILLVAFISLLGCPIDSSVLASTDKQSLYEFLKNTENINASYKYPSIKISTNSVGKTTLPAHTPIQIYCTQTISTRDIVSGGIVNFAVNADVKDSHGTILIKTGTPVTARITFAKKNGMIGHSGEITIDDFHTTAIDGTYIPLSGSISNKPDDDKMVVSIVLSVFVCPLFLLLKGDEAQVYEGTTKTVYTVSDVYIKPVKS